MIIGGKRDVEEEPDLMCGRGNHHECSNHCLELSSVYRRRNHWVPSWGQADGRCQRSPHCKAPSCEMRRSPPLAQPVFILREASHNKMTSKDILYDIGQKPLGSMHVLRLYMPWQGLLTSASTGPAFGSSKAMSERDYSSNTPQGSVRCLADDRC